MGFSRQEYWSGLPFPSPCRTTQVSSCSFPGPPLGLPGLTASLFNEYSRVLIFHLLRSSRNEKLRRERNIRKTLIISLFIDKTTKNADSTSKQNAEQWLKIFYCWLSNDKGQTFNAMLVRHIFFGIITIGLESFLWEHPEVSSAPWDDANLQHGSWARGCWKVASSRLLLVIEPPASLVST